MSTLKRLLKEAQTSASECSRMLSRLDDVSNDDISLLHAASNQAAQAAKEINQMIGFLQCKLEERQK